METADMVKVAVSAAPYSIDKPYSYLVPEALSKTAVPGVRVIVPPALSAMPMPRGMPVCGCSIRKTVGSAPPGMRGFEQRQEDLFVFVIVMTAICLRTFIQWRRQ